MTPYGCVLFNANNIKNGWACKANDQPYKIKSIGELDNNHIWISNLSFDQIWQNGLNSHARIKGSDFLGRPLAEILRYYGILDPLSNPEQRKISDININGKDLTATIARIAQRIGTLMEKQFDLNIEEASPLWTLPAMIGEAFSTRPFLQKTLVGALENADQAWTRVEGHIMPNESIVRLHIAGHTHLKKMLETTRLPHPNSQWHNYKNDNAEKKATEKIRSNPCAIARINITGISDLWSNILNFGTFTHQGRKLWVTSLDYLFLENSINSNKAIGKQSEIEVVETWYPEKDFLFAEFFKDKEVQSLTQKGNGFSIALSIACTAFWTGLAQPKKSTRSSITKNNQTLLPASIYAPFLRSVDRNILLGAVLKLTEKSIRVSGYGKGAIDIVDDNYKPSDWLSISTLTGLDCPILNKETLKETLDENYKDTMPINNDDETEIIRMTKLTMGSDTALAADTRSTEKILSNLNLGADNE